MTNSPVREIKTNVIERSAVPTTPDGPVTLVRASDDGGGAFDGFPVRPIQDDGGAFMPVPPSVRYWIRLTGPWSMR